MLASKRLLIMCARSSSTLSIVACRVSARDVSLEGRDSSCEIALHPKKMRRLLFRGFREYPSTPLSMRQHRAQPTTVSSRGIWWRALAVKISIKISSRLCADQVGMPFLHVTRLSAPARAYGSHELFTHSTHAVRSHLVQRRPPRYVRASLVYTCAHQVRDTNLFASSPSTWCRLYRLTYGRLTTGT